jgi:hypothetical protein
MLQGTSIRLRLVRETDLDLLFLCLTDIRKRGEYFPINVPSEARLRKQYQDCGFWEEDNGLLLITNAAGAVMDTSSSSNRSPIWTPTNCPTCSTPRRKG